MSAGPAGKPIVAVTAKLPGWPLANTAEVSDLDRVEVRLAELTSIHPAQQRGELLAFVRDAAAVVVMFNHRVDAEFLDACGPQLRAVCAYAVGVDNIDLTECARRGVKVAHTPDAVTEGTANLALALVLAVGRRVVRADSFVRSGGFAASGNGFPNAQQLGSPECWMGIEFAGRTALIVGPGRIGFAVAKRLMAIGMRIVYTSRTSKPAWEVPVSAGGLGAQRVDLHEGLAQADVVSVHTPLTEQTRHLIGAAELALLGPTSILINTSRGPVVDERALVAILRAGKIFGAGLDVFEREPELAAGLAELPNVVLTPHIGSAERLHRARMTEMAVGSAVQGALGQEMAWLVG